MSIALRCLQPTVGLAALVLASGFAPPPASANLEATLIVDAKRTQVDNVTLETYSGYLSSGGKLKILAGGHASISVEDAAATMIVQCEVTPTSASMFVIHESVRGEPTGLSFRMPANEPSSVIEFAVTPEPGGDVEYAIRSKDRSPFWIHWCSVTAPGGSLESPISQSPHRISPTGAVSKSGELAVVEGHFVKWLRDAVVVDANKVMTLEIGPGAPERTQVQCEVDLDLAEQTTFEIELVDQHTTISQVVEQGGSLSFTAWGAGRVNISNPTQMWLWQSCELVG